MRHLRQDVVLGDQVQIHPDVRRLVAIYMDQMFRHRIFRQHHRDLLGHLALVAVRQDVVQDENLVVVVALRIRDALVLVAIRVVVVLVVVEVVAVHLKYQMDYYQDAQQMVAALRDAVHPVANYLVVESLVVKHEALARSVVVSSVSVDFVEMRPDLA
jgi:hypothetical protein